MAIPQKPKAKQQSNYRPPDQPLAHVPRQLHDPPGAVGQPNNYSETVHRRQESMPRKFVEMRSVKLAGPLLYAASTNPSTPFAFLLIRQAPFPSRLSPYLLASPPEVHSSWTILVPRKRTRRLKCHRPSLRAPPT